MKIYVASKFEHKILARTVMDFLELSGYTITCDWTKHEWPEHYNGKELYSKDIELTNHFASNDINGIHEAEIIIVLYAGIKGPGMSFEMGYAKALNKKIIMVGNDTKEYSIFCHSENFIHCKDYKELTKHLVEYNCGKMRRGET
jgi:nucleoside 2-deoxyribosyltransferase